MNKLIITQEQLKEQLHYNQDTGIFTRLVSNSNKIKIGDIAGGVDHQGYVRVRLNGKKYAAHRLAWLYITGYLPVDAIDHINGIKDDNRFCNLREATWEQNLRNTGIRASNTSGYKGVSWHKKTSTWMARCRVNGSEKYIGIYETPELASKAYQEFARKHHGEFYREP